MIRNRVILKSIAVFLILETAFSIVSPTISWALTAGPTAPEFSSFEPVDTTDMVNLATGDLVYNIPLMEVPGPAGGYPFSLSYHAGIMPETAASWVGLGWTLNMGSISRSVSMFPDDNQGTRSDIRDFWDGGETVTKTYTLGVTIPNSGIGLSYTHARTQDTYKGFSSNDYMGVSINPIALASSLSSGNFGNMGLASKRNATRVENQDNARGAQGMQYASPVAGYVQGKNPLNGGASMNFTISSSGIQSSLTVAGYTFSQKGGGGGIHSYSSSTDKGGIGIWIFSYGQREYYTRYWSDQTDALFSYGALHTAELAGKQDYIERDIPYNNAEYRSYAGDIYDLYEPNTDLNAHDGADPTKQLGGSVPAFDNYVVQGQGIGGVMRPYIFDNIDIRGQNRYHRISYNGSPALDCPTVKYLQQVPTPDKKWGFRFRNELSNHNTVSEGTLREVRDREEDAFDVVNRTMTADPAGYGDAATGQKLAGTRDISWFTNKEIALGQAGRLMDCYNTRAERPRTKNIYDEYLQPEACLPHEVNGPARFGRQEPIIKTDTYDENFFDHINFLDMAYSSLDPEAVSLDEKIGGFMITNASGVTYHYALPVYAYNEYTRMRKKKPLKGAATITEVRKNEPYAYTWLLTAITGPDFVDRGGSNGLGNGIVDDGDYGYWVKFDYGLWTDSYQWRTPHTGYTTDVESEYESFSYGIKELYYLDAIETSTHKALFVKSKRKDGRGVTSRLEGGSNPREFKMEYRKHSGEKFAELNFAVSPVSTMKLDAIYLFDKKHLAEIPLTKARGSKYNDSPISSPAPYRYNGTPYTKSYGSGGEVRIDNSDRINVKYHNGDLVLDDGDIAGLDLAGSALRTIQFHTSYTLAPNTANSIGYFSDILRDPNTNLALTCADPASCDPHPQEDYDFEWPLSYGNGCGMPPRAGVFGDKYAPYCCEPELSMDKLAFYGEFPLQKFEYVNYAFQCPDAQKKYRGGNVKYYKTGKLTLDKIKVLGYGGTDLIPSTKFAYTKNPAYNGRMYDEWGYYKSDYTDDHTASYYPGGIFTVPTAPGVVSTRRISSVSAANVDAWSLTSVTTPMGASLGIEYEPNRASSVYNDHAVFGIEKMERLAGDQVKIYFNEKGVTLADYFGYALVDIKALFAGTYTNPNDGLLKVRGDIYDTPDNEVIAVNSDHIVVRAPDLNMYLGPRVVAPLPGPPALTSYFINGAVSVPERPEMQYAGGIRTKAVVVSDVSGHESRTTYTYSHGVTAFKPFTAVGVHYPTENTTLSEVMTDKDLFYQRQSLMTIQAEFQKVLNKLHEKILMFSRESPGLAVVYPFVTVRNSFDGLPTETYQKHQFTPFDESMITRTSNDYSPASTLTRNVRIKNQTALVGALLRVANYASADDRLLGETRFGYLNDGADAGFEALQAQAKQGVIEESFQKGLVIQEFKPNYNSQGNDLGMAADRIYKNKRAVITKTEEWPTAMTSVQKYDYLSGQTESTEYWKFDFYSGEVTESRFKDSYGNSYLTEVTPAYKEYAALGLGVKGNANMLSQSVGAMTYKIDASGNKIGLLSGEVQTWSNGVTVLAGNASTQPAIWRKHRSFTFVGNDNAVLGSDGLYKASEVTSFTAWDRNAAPTAGWQLNSAVTLYNTSSAALEAVDLNNDYAAVRAAHRGNVVASVAGARYDEFRYSGAEGTSTPGQADDIHLGQAQVVATGLAHSGKNAFLLEVGARGVTSVCKIQKKRYDRKMRVSFWVYKPAEIHVFPPVPAKKRSISISYAYSDDPAMAAEDVVVDVPLDNSKTVLLSVRPGGLDARSQLCTVEIPLPESVIQSKEFLTMHLINTGEDKLYVDDFRAYPLGSAVTSYVYNERNELACMLDADNMGTFYTYDDMGRLKTTATESFSFGKMQTSEVAYNYGREHISSFTVDASKIGSSGSVSIIGSSTAIKGGSLSFQIKETCSSPQLAEILIDHQPIGMQNTNVTLFDGTRVSLEGLRVTFSNLQSNHILQAKFRKHEGEVRCRRVSDLPGQCFDGSYEYAYYNGCGERGAWQVAPNASAVPANLQYRIPSNCIELNNTSACSQN